MRRILFYIFIFFNLNVSAQIDSLENILPSLKDNIKVDALNELAYLYAKKLPVKGLLYAKKALENAEAIKYLNGELSALNNIGINQSTLGEYDDALKSYFSAIELLEENGRSNEIPQFLSNIALVYSDIGRYDDAILYLNKVLILLNGSNNTRQYLAPLINLSVIYRYKKDYKNALKSIMKADSINKTFKSDRIRFLIYYNKASIYNRLKNNNEAIMLANNALHLIEKTNDRTDIVNTYTLLAKIYLDRNENADALSYILKARVLAKEMNLNLDIAYTYELSSYYYKNIGNNIEALSDYNIMKSINDSLNIKEQSVKVNNLKEKYESDASEKKLALLEKDSFIQNLKIKERENQKNVLLAFVVLLLLLLISIYLGFRIKRKDNLFLIRKNKLISLQKEKLDIARNILLESNAQKDKLISIIAHDLRNPFNVILGFAEMLKEDFDSLDETARKSYIKTISESSQFTFNLLEDILLWARANNNSIKLSLEKHNLLELVNKAINPVVAFAGNKNIEIYNNINESVCIVIDSFTMSTIIGNIVSNAIKFTNNGGVINISYYSDNNIETILIEDTGVGMTMDKIESLFSINKNQSTSGTSNEKGSGLGMLLCKEFISMYNGEIIVESEISKGSKFFINIPKKK